MRITTVRYRTLYGEWIHYNVQNLLNSFSTIETLTMTTPNSYQKIAVHQGEGEDASFTLTPLASPPGRTTSKTTMVVSAVSVAVVFALFCFSSTSSSTGTTAAASSSATAPLESMAGPAPPRPCSFSECLASRCDPDHAPYLCLFHNGGPHGGCSPVPWNDWSCDESCDSSACASLPIPDDVEPCNGKVCSKEWCNTAAAQLCGPAVPYQCTGGPARFGCSDDVYHWVMEGCECCDARTCG